jgi:ribosomal protein S17E
MDKFLQKFDNVSSLGYNCFPKIYFTSKKINQETHFFDYIGTSVWSIIELFKNDFEGMFDHENYKIMNIMKTGDNQQLVVNDKYFIRCKHDFKKTLLKPCEIDNTELNTFIEKMKRRKERLMNMLLDNKSLIFIRYEEDRSGRHIIEEYEPRYETSYIDNLKILSKLFRKINPLKKIIIMNISHLNDKTEYIEEYGIIKIRMDKKIECWSRASIDFEKTFTNEKDFFEKIVCSVKNF